MSHSSASCNSSRRSSVAALGSYNFSILREVNSMLKYVVAAQSFAMNTWGDLRHREDGQTVAEYGVALAIASVGIIVALVALSGGITDALNKVTTIIDTGA